MNNSAKFVLSFIMFVAAIVIVVLAIDLRSRFISNDISSTIAADFSEQGLCSGSGVTHCLQTQQFTGRVRAGQLIIGSDSFPIVASDQDILYTALVDDNISTSIVTTEDFEGQPVLIPADVEEFITEDNCVQGSYTYFNRYEAEQEDANFSTFTANQSYLELLPCQSETGLVPNFTQIRYLILE